MKMSDRRLAHRFDLAVPLRFRAWNSVGPEESVVSRNVSERGLYFETDSPVPTGMALQVRFEMPEEVTGSPTTEWKCTGQVVRVEPARTSTRKIGVGVRIDYYEVLRKEKAGSEQTGIL